MKKNKIIELFGGLSIAVAGIAAVVSGVKENKVESVNADAVAMIDVFLSKPNSGYDDAWKNDVYCKYTGGSSTHTGDHGDVMAFAYINENSETVAWISIPADTTKIQFYGWQKETYYDNTVEINFDGSVNGYYLTGGNWGSRTYGTYTATYLKAKSQFYLSTASLTGWEDEGAIMVAHVWNGVNATDIVGKKVLDNIENTHLYEFEIPSSDTKIYKYLMFKRNDPSGGTWNESNNLTYSTKNVASIKGWDKSISWNDTVVSSLDRANYYGRYFISKLSCNYITGESNPKYLQSGWSLCKTEYNNMALLSQGTFWKANANENGNDCEKAAARYDEIIKKHGTSNYENFVNRTISSSANNYLISFENSNAATWVIAFVSLTGLTAIGGYFFYKKRKEQQ